MKKEKPRKSMGKSQSKKEHEKGSLQNERTPFFFVVKQD